MPVNDLELKTFKAIVECIEEGSEKPSRAAIAKELGLSRTTASNYVNKLISAEILEELDSESQGRGRPGKPLTLSTSKRYAIGAFFDEHDWYLSIVNLQGQPVENLHYPIERMTIDSFIQVLIGGIKHIQKKYGAQLLPAVGIGSPGVIDRKTGTIIKAVDLGWRDIPLGRIVQNQTGFSCYILNRYRATGLGEAHHGQGQGVRDFIFIGVGTGMGSAIFIDGKLMFTTNIHTGGIGHIIVDPHGPYCSCGRKGCALPLASTDALITNVLNSLADKTLPTQTTLALQYATEKTLTLAQIMQAAQDGDVFAQQAVQTVADPMCQIIGHLITIINPKKIVLGGPMATTGTYYVDYIEKKVVNDYLTPEIPIVQGSMDVYTGARGAASLVTKRVVELTFHTPDTWHLEQ